MVNTGDMSVNPGNTSTLVYKYMRPEHLPHIWCPGCGNGIIMRDVAQAIENLGLSRNKTVIVSGIGCSSRAAGYLDFNTIHTTHGRAIAFATGIKLANPELEVIVLAGDGDISAIGGNHLIHAARRNIGLTVVVFNNEIYGMTGGQFSPLSGRGIRATTAPYGNIDTAFDTVQLALGAGATFVARTTVFHVMEMVSLIKKAYQHKGFSVLEVLTDCPTYFGRKNKLGGPVQMLEWFRDNTAPLGSKKYAENPAFIPRGVFRDVEAPEYCEEYDKLIASVRKEEA